MTAIDLWQALIFGGACFVPLMLWYMADQLVWSLCAQRHVDFYFDDLPRNLR